MRARTALLLAFTCAAVPAAAQPSPIVFAPSSGFETGTEFGRNVALFQDHAAVGSFARLGNVTNAGAVFLYQNDGTSWSLADLIQLDTPTAGDLFGASVALSEVNAGANVLQPSLLVGAPGRGDAGAVSHYLLGDNGWTLSQTLLPERDTMGFGEAVASERFLLVVGAPQENSGALASGAVYFYEYREDSGTGDRSFQLRGRFTPPSPTQGQSFGAAVSIDAASRSVLVGAPGEVVGGVPTGAVYTYRIIEDPFTGQSLPVPETKFVSPGSALAFGDAVAVDSDRAIVGAPFGNGVVQGEAWLYEFSNNRWTLEQKLVVPDLSLTAEYGQAVAIDGNQATVSALRDDASGARSGSVFLFQKQGEVWGLADTLFVPGAASNDQLGVSLTMDGRRALTGAPLADTRRGTAYLFDTRTSVAEEPTAPPTGFALSAPAPNPTRSHATLTLDVEMPQTVRVVLYDALGREVAVLHDGLVSGTASLRVATDGLAAGVYALRATGTDGVLTHRITVVR